MLARILASVLMLSLGLALLPGCTDAPDGDTQAPSTEASGASTAELNATVLGSAVRADTPEELQAAVLTPIFDAYARDNGIEVEEAEVEAWVANLERGMAEDSVLAAEPDEELTEEEQAELAAMRQEMGRSIIKQWKINRALYEEYGGRIIYQQLGPEPLDAYREYLEERGEAGDFSFDGPTAEAAFWRYFRDESMHSFIEPGSDDETQAFAVAPWQRGPE